MWHVVGEKINGGKVLVGNPEIDNLEDLAIDGRIILLRIFKTWGGMCTELMQLSPETSYWLL
jgi:hypothetical protein